MKRLLLSGLLSASLLTACGGEEVDNTGTPIANPRPSTGSGNGNGNGSGNGQGTPVTPPAPVVPMLGGTKEVALASMQSSTKAAVGTSFYVTSMNGTLAGGGSGGSTDDDTEKCTGGGKVFITTVKSPISATREITFSQALTVRFERCSVDEGQTFMDGTIEVRRNTYLRRANENDAVEMAIFPSDASVIGRLEITGNINDTVNINVLEKTPGYDRTAKGTPVKLSGQIGTRAATHSFYNEVYVVPLIKY
jgi:hypothetical protein